MLSLFSSEGQPRASDIKGCSFTAGHVHHLRTFIGITVLALFVFKAQEKSGVFFWVSLVCRVRFALLLNSVGSAVRKWALQEWMVKTVSYRRVSAEDLRRPGKSWEGYSDQALA